MQKNFITVRMGRSLAWISLTRPVSLANWAISSSVTIGREEKLTSITTYLRICISKRNLIYLDADRNTKLCHKDPRTNFLYSFHRHFVFSLFRFLITELFVLWQSFSFFLFLNTFYSLLFFGSNSCLNHVVLQILFALQVFILFNSCFQTYLYFRCQYFLWLHCQCFILFEYRCLQNVTKFPLSFTLFLSLIYVKSKFTSWAPRSFSLFFFFFQHSSRSTW